jgi:TLD
MVPKSDLPQPKSSRKANIRSNITDNPLSRDNDTSIFKPSVPQEVSIVPSPREIDDTTESTMASGEVWKSKQYDVKVVSSRKKCNSIIPTKLNRKLLPVAENKRGLLSTSASSSSLASSPKNRTYGFDLSGFNQTTKDSMKYSTGTAKVDNSSSINESIKKEQTSSIVTGDDPTQTSDVVVFCTETSQQRIGKNEKFTYSPSRRIETPNDKTIHQNSVSNTNKDWPIETKVPTSEISQQPGSNKQSYEEIQDKLFRPKPYTANGLNISRQQKDVGSNADEKTGDKALPGMSKDVVHFADTTILLDTQINYMENDEEDMDDFAEASLPSRPGTDHGESKPDRPSVGSISDSIGLDTISTTSHDAIGTMISSSDSNKKHLSKATLAAVAELDDIVRSLKNTIQVSNSKSPKQRQKHSQSQRSPSRTTCDLNINRESPRSKCQRINYEGGISPKNSRETSSPKHDRASSLYDQKTGYCVSVDDNQDFETCLNQRSSHSRTHDDSRGGEVPSCKRVLRKAGHSSTFTRSTAIHKVQDNCLPKNSLTSYVDVLASSWDTDGEGDDESTSLYGDEDEPHYPIEGAISSLPSDVDPQVNRRYLAMSQVLKDTLDSNKHLDLRELETSDQEILRGLLMGKKETHNDSRPSPEEAQTQTQPFIDVGTGHPCIDFSDHTYGQMSTSLFTSVESVYSSEFYNSTRFSTVPSIDRRHRGTTMEQYSHAIGGFGVNSNNMTLVGTRPVSPSLSRMSDATPMMFNGRNSPSVPSLNVNRYSTFVDQHNHTLDASTRAFSASSLFTNIEDDSLPFLVLDPKNFVDDKKTILTMSMMAELKRFLPIAHANENFYLKFCSQRDGSSLSTLLHQVQWCKNTIITIETSDGDIFGAFCSSFWRIQSNWFGSEKSFLWKMIRNTQNNDTTTDGATMDTSSTMRKSSIQVFPWTGHDQFIQHCSTKGIAIGGGSGSEVEENKSNKSDSWSLSSSSIGLLLDGDLMSGETNPCSTFANTTLLCDDKSTFEILSIEVWTLTPCMTVENALELEEQRALVENHAFL